MATITARLHAWAVTMLARYVSSQKGCLPMPCVQAVQQELLIPITLSTRHVYTGASCQRVRTPICTFLCGSNGGIATMTGTDTEKRHSLCLPSQQVGNCMQPTTDYQPGQDIIQGLMRYARYLQYSQTKFYVPACQWDYL